MRSWILIMMMCGVASAATEVAPEVEVEAAPAIATAPATGLDPDVVARLDEVDRDVARVAPAELDRVLERALVTFESDDPFSIAQRVAARPRTIAVLTKLGERARAAGELVIAARAFDARWAISGTHDVQLAEVLTTWAERDAATQPGKALYLARRARAADPASGRAVELDDDLSTKHRAVTGKLAIVAGVVALAVGIYARTRVSAIEDDLHTHPRPGAEVDAALADRDRYDMIGTGLVIAAPILSFGGLAWMLSGNPSHEPSSPGELPALVDR
jgi:hypothetical protein